MKSFGNKKIPAQVLITESFKNSTSKFKNRLKIEEYGNKTS